MKIMLTLLETGGKISFVAEQDNNEKTKLKKFKKVVDKRKNL